MKINLNAFVLDCLLVFLHMMQPAQQVFRCGLGPKNEERQVKDRAENGPSKRAGRGWGQGQGQGFFFFFVSRFISRAVKTESPLPRSFFAPKPNGNACYQATHDGDRWKPKVKRLRQIIQLICSVHVGLVVHSLWEQMHKSYAHLLEIVKTIL